MKLTLSYIPEESDMAAEFDKSLIAQHPGTKRKESSKHPPNRHIYYYIPTQKQNHKRLGKPPAATLDEAAEP